MAITLGTDTVTNKERTKSIFINTPVGDVPTITVYREKTWEDAKGNIIRREDGKIITKLYADIADSTIGSMTGTELYTYIAGIADTWSQEG